MAAKKKPFEESMTRLEEIVSILERGESTLDESLALFEEGTKLAAKCSALLDTAGRTENLKVDQRPGRRAGRNAFERINHESISI